jgi:hypothetical protein
MFDSCSTDDWDTVSDGSPGAGWDPPFDGLNFAKRDLGSRSEREAGRRELRASDPGAAGRLTAWAGRLTAWAGCSAALAGCLADATAAEWGQESNAERGQELIAVEACC